MVWFVGLGDIAAAVICILAIKDQWGDRKRRRPFWITLQNLRYGTLVVLGSSVAAALTQFFFPASYYKGYLPCLVPFLILTLGLSGIWYLVEEKSIRDLLR